MDYSYKVKEFLRTSSLDTFYRILTPKLAQEYGIDYDYLQPGQLISDDYDIIYLGSIIAKQKYSDILADNNYEFLDIGESSDGTVGAFVEASRRLYDVSEDEIFDIIDDAEYL